MADQLKLMCILAHPDDESLGTGGVLARYAAEGVETYLVTATRGERGWFGAAEDNPGLEALGRIREGELRAAADILDIREVTFLDYIDGELDEANPADVIDTIAQHIRRVRPQVVITFDPFGAYGHPDHIAISQFTAAAVVAAAYCDDASPWPAHRVTKLYYFAETTANLNIYEDALGELVMNIDGEERRATAWPDWAITTQVDTAAYWQQVWQAVQQHRTQLPGYAALQQLPGAIHRHLWGTQNYYRAFSLVNGGRETETDLFEGLRQPQPETA